MANIIPITSFSAPELDVFARLTENQLVNRADPANAMFIAESPLVIGRALDGGCVPLSFLMETKHVEGKAAEILSRCPEDVSWQDTLHGLGFKTAAMALRDDTLPLSDPRLEKEPKLAVVLGTEGDGLANTTIEHCDYTVKIPMSHGVDSLNVAAASAVAFYQLGTLHNNV